MSVFVMFLLPSVCVGALRQATVTVIVKKYILSRTVTVTCHHDDSTSILSRTVAVTSHHDDSTSICLSLFIQELYLGTAAEDFIYGACSDHRTLTPFDS
jgi:hypothetical protein